MLSACNDGVVAGENVKVAVGGVGGSAKSAA